MKNQRFWEIDFLRGIAIIMMIIYHFLFDLIFFFDYNINIYSGFWKVFQIVTATIFITLVGMSLTLSYSKNKNNFKKYLIRGLKIFSWGLVISFVTLFFLKEQYIRFGILHLIGLSIILAYPFIRFKAISFIIGSLLVIVGISFDFVVNSHYLIWLGFMYPGFNSVDYFPLLPWFGVILIGIFLGNTFYQKHNRKFRIFDFSNNLVVDRISFLGKKSLIIYLIHQPILLGILFIISKLI